MSESPIKKIIGKSRTELGKMAASGRSRLDMRSLQKDRKKMIDKLGREVIALAESNEIVHPGLLKAVERIKALDLQSDDFKQISFKELADRAKTIHDLSMGV